MILPGVTNIKIYHICYLQPFTSELLISFVLQNAELLISVE